MCIVALAWNVLENMPICLLSNRDEFYERRSTKIKYWENSPIIAGQDLKSKGTWLGITATGRWAIITNYRDGLEKKTYTTSRGTLVEAFLTSDLTPIRFAQYIEKIQHEYAGFNLIIGTNEQAVYMSNRGEAPQVLANGIYILSNGLLSDEWQKNNHLRKRFTQELIPVIAEQNHFDLAKSEQHTYKENEEKQLQAIVWDILQDQRQVATDLLPNTGVAQDLEKVLSSTFIQSPHYGTKCSNFLRLIKTDHEALQWVWLEKTYKHSQIQNQIQSQNDSEDQSNCEDDSLSQIKKIEQRINSPVAQ